MRKSTKLKNLIIAIDMPTIQELLDTIGTQCKIILELNKINERLNNIVAANSDLAQINKLYKHLKKENGKLAEENRTLRNLYSSVNLNEEIFGDE